MGAVVSSSHVVSAPPLKLSGGGLLTLCPCSRLGSFLQGTVLHELLQSEFFPQAAALHKLFQSGFIPWAAVLQEQAAPAWVPHRVTSPVRKPAPAWAPLSMGPQVLQGACSSIGSPWGHRLLQACPCSGVGFSVSCRWISTPLWTSMGCGVTACLTVVLSTGCRRIFAPVPGATPPPPSPTLMSAQLLLSHILTPLSCCNCAGFFPPA